MTIRAIIQSILVFFEEHLAVCLYGATSFLDFLDNSSLGFLFVLALVAWFTSSLFPLENIRCRFVANSLAGLFFILHFGVTFWRFRAADVLELVSLILRSVAGAVLVFGSLNATLYFAAIVLSTVHRCSIRIRLSLSRLCRNLFRWWSEYRHRRAAARVPEPITPSRSEILATLSDQARQDFELEQELINSADGIDSDERSALLQAAKQRYIQKLNGILQ